ncbi:DUF4435 domain-containing protein [Pseudomonas sp. MM211]|uniref:DUF4435 domain-containing protein n=1 Tax=Pseudomonas sp. MM211 TaxID=2866808 RepID=UPI001CECC299|nr:DUF4435 domain-containing protein [Pseudomonas sp. MM211]UCJ18598.1 DUF4435 domain-containing protein [Pseudomonas sp. MM211]
MTSRLNLFMEYAEGEEVHFVEYIKTRPADGLSKAVMVLEGKDDPKFYTPKFSSLLNREWTSISVGGKSKVLELRKKIRSHPKFFNDLTFFFVDRDYDQTITFKDTYVTPTYSIENLYCSRETVKRLIEAECGLTRSDITNRLEIIDFLLEEYESLRKKFHTSRSVKFLNSVFYYVRTQKQNKKISLDKVLKLEALIEKDKLKIILTKNELFIKNRKIEREDYIKAIANSSWLAIANNPADRFRGKQEILILRLYVRELKNSGSIANKALAKFGMKICTENPSMSDHILSTASQYVPSPRCLTKFLASI